MPARPAAPMAALAVLAAVLAASCGSHSPPDSSGSRGFTVGAGVVPFGTFLASVRAARYRDYSRRPGTRVQNRDAFAEMRSYLLARYQHARVTASYRAGDTTFDCTRARPAAQPPPAPASAPATAPATAIASRSSAPCPEDSIPVQRVTLDDLARFPTLHQYLNKSPGGTGSLPPR